MASPWKGQASADEIRDSIIRGCLMDIGLVELGPQDAWMSSLALARRLRCSHYRLLGILEARKAHSPESAMRPHFYVEYMHVDSKGNRQKAYQVSCAGVWSVIAEFQGERAAEVKDAIAMLIEAGYQFWRPPIDD